MISKVVIGCLFVTCCFAAQCLRSNNQKLYEEWGCSPIVNPNNCGDECNPAYDCKQIFNRPRDMCFLNGKYFKIDEAVPVSGLEYRCEFGCFCANFSGKPELICAVADCFFPPPNDTCRQTYSKIDQCCAQYDCTPLSNETNCTYKNDDLYLYERFNDGCNICLCTPSGVICEEIKCFEEKYYLEKIDAKCAPVFAEQACCPINLKCSSANDIIKRSPGNSSKQGKCLYGSRQLPIGTVVLNTQEKVSCKCEQPPLLSCKRTQ